MKDLHEALVRGDLDAVKRLLTDNPALIEAGDDEPLSHAAARDASLETLRYLVEYALRVNLNAVDRRGRDLLHYAAQSGDVEKCRYLVERGGLDPLRADADGLTPYELSRIGGHAALEAYFQSLVGAPLESMYKNPVLRGMYPDPSIVRVGEDFYMVHSTFVYFPCIPVSHSRDLVHWRLIGHAIENPDWAELEGLEGGRGYWAPDISYADGRFYICATYRHNDEGPIRRRQMIVSAARPEGPYTKPVFFHEEGIDPSLFHDDDGRHYLLVNRGARLMEMDLRTLTPMGRPKLLYYGSYGRSPEGPHLVKKDGWYYLFLAEGGTGMGHRETVARSRTLWGPYLKSPYGPVIRQTDERALIQRCGHGKPVMLADGRWFMPYLCGRALEGKHTVLGRETALDELRWTPDGWPLLDGPSSMRPLPLPSVKAPGPTDWLTPRAPKDGEIRWEGERLVLLGGAFALADRRCTSLLLRRQTAFSFRFDAVLTVPCAGEAGVVCYYDEHSFLALGVCVNAEGCRLRAYEQAGYEANERAVVETKAMPGDQITLSVQARGLGRWLSFAQAGAPEQLLCRVEDTAYLSDEGVAIGKRFTGAMVGLYALFGAKATFERIRYTPQTEGIVP